MPRDTPTTAPSATDELPARRFVGARQRGDGPTGRSAWKAKRFRHPQGGSVRQYRYDEIGNRKTSGSTGLANTADDEYTPNALNQYTTRENNTVKVLGLASTVHTPLA